MLGTTRGVGQYVASEAHSALTSRWYRPGSGRRPIIFFTGGPGNDREFLDVQASGSLVAARLARAGWPVYSAAFGGANLWGNATTVTRIGQAWTHAKTLLGTATDKFIGVGVSKGATALLNYARANPANVAALALAVPAVDIQDIHANNRGGAAAAIAAAHGGAPSDALNPADDADDFAALPIKCWYASDDTTCLPATVTAFAAAAEAELRDLGAVGHTAATVDPHEVVAWVGDNG